MKRVYIFLTTMIISGILLSGCEGLLEEHPKANTVETFMRNKDEVEKVMLSIYYQLKRDVGYGRYKHTIVEAMSDYCYGSGSYAFPSNYEGLDQTNTTRVADTWAILYRGIRYANTILNAIPSATLRDKERAELTGEARFLRAFNYSSLVKSWGGVPLFDENNMEELTKPRADVNDLYDFIVADLLYAEQNLPDTPAQAGRPAKTAAKTLLCEIYLYMERWAEARDKAQEVINSGKHSLVEVAISDDFYKIFGPDVVTTPEEIFYLKYNSMNNFSYFTVMLHTTQTSYMVPNTGFMGIYSLPSNKIMSEWDSADLRKGFNQYERKVQNIDRILNKKYIDPDCQANGGTSNDFPLYKYSDVLLYYAEAACRAGGAPTADAMEKLNMVHRRAYGHSPNTASAADFKLSDYSTEAKFLDLVLKERGYETMYEGKRYDDLKRCGKLAEAISYAKGVTIKSEAAYWWPIPATEFRYNPYMDLETDQNPGY